MEININNLIPFEKAINETIGVFELVEKNGRVVILKNNQPAYIIMKYDGIEQSHINQDTIQNKITLQEAMKIVLQGSNNHTLHASELADIIYNRKLYLQKNGGKAQYTQIRARCGHYPDLFEALPGNYIKLIV